MPGSLYEPSHDLSSADEEVIKEAQPQKPLAALNDYLERRDLSPIRSQLRTSWVVASDRTKRYYTRKAGQAVAAMVKDISPRESGPLLHEVISSDALRHQLSSSEDSTDDKCVDETLMLALAECFDDASSWETRRQILSIMADKVRHKKIIRYIPGLSKYRFTEAKRHCLIYGRGVPVSNVRAPRRDVATPQIEHFISYICSPHVIQDLPFAEQTITLSTQETIKIPNVIRMAIPERLVKQYQAYCEESGFASLSRSTLLRILSICSASTPKSSQGLDYVSSTGAQAFEELLDVVERIGDLGKGMDWAKDVQNRLCAGKRYMKGDFKVCIKHKGRLFSKIIYVRAHGNNGKSPHR